MTDPKRNGYEVVNMGKVDESNPPKGGSAVVSNSTDISKKDYIESKKPKEIELIPCPARTCGFITRSKYD